MGGVDGRVRFLHNVMGLWLLSESVRVWERDGDRIPLPELNQERRKELSKLASKYAEAARIAVRNVRRDGMEILKRLEKDHKIGEDEHHTKGEELQKLTDRIKRMTAR